MRSKANWKAGSIGHAAEFLSFGEAILRPAPALGGSLLNLLPPCLSGDWIFKSKLADFVLSHRGPGGTGLMAFAGKFTGFRLNQRPDDTEKANSGSESVSETGREAQPSDEDGVSVDMATLVLDKSALGAGQASRPDSRPERHAGPMEGLDPASDAAVMLRVAAGDEEGFNFLVGKYHRAMIHFLFRMVRNQAIAEELAQEVFLRVYRSRESYRAEAKFTTWLYRIATNLAVNHARDTRHERAAATIYLDAPDEETGATPDVADDEPSVEQSLMRDERMAAISKHVMALPERQKSAVLMHKYQGMDYRQIGEVLKLSESATKSLLFRAYQTLRDKLKDFV
jgi:RNA polymerase sigma-70 factor, ECF subfamily